MGETSCTPPSPKPRTIGSIYSFLQRITRWTNCNLSAHLSKLSEARLVTIEKRFVSRKPNTNVAITAKERHAVAEHWRRLEQPRAGARGLSRGSP